MKKLFALLTLAALLMTAFVCPTLAESPMTGGWSAYTDDPTEIPAEALDALNAALEELVAASTSRLRCWRRRLSRARITASCAKRPSLRRMLSRATRWSTSLTGFRATTKFCACRRSSFPHLNKRS